MKCPVLSAERSGRNHDQGVGSLFGGIRLTWLKVITAAVMAGDYTAVMTVLPAAAMTVYGLVNPSVYTAELLASSEELPFDTACTVSLAEPECGKAEIICMDSVEDCVVRAGFR